jgi:histone arginine demethylase JMJD6
MTQMSLSSAFTERSSHSNLADPALGVAGRFPEVDRRERLSVRQFKHEYLHTNCPVVITDAIEHWPARNKWTMDFFRSIYGHLTPSVYHYDPQNQFTGGDVQRARLGEFIDNVTTRDWAAYPYYLRDDWRILHEHPELKKDYTKLGYFFDWFELLPPFMRMPYPRLFIGPKGAVTPVHMDVWRTHAWLAQFVGRKRWIFFPPEQESLLYDFNVRVEQPDLVKHPRYAEARPLEATIGPGDTIFAPSGWAHWVISLDASLSLSGNYMGPGCFRSCAPNILKSFVVDRVRRKLRGN